ncbi:GNAT family N-acetyltransferase [archaeon]|nr:GNAT family N-acetyltransferase [archaeon]
MRAAYQTMNLQIRFGVPKNQRYRVAKIFYETFEGTISKNFGNKNKFLLFTSKCLRDDRILVAFKDGLAVGFAGLQYDKKSFIDANLRQTLKIFGLGALRVALFGRMFFFNKAAKNEILIDSIAVSANEQGKGIGSKLLQSTIDHAQSKGFSQIKLEVIETNQNARRLYERVGFKEAKVQKIPYPFSRLLGFGSVTEMVYRL